MCLIIILKFPLRGRDAFESWFATLQRGFQFAPSTSVSQSVFGGGQLSADNVLFKKIAESAAVSMEINGLAVESDDFLDLRAHVAELFNTEAIRNLNGSPRAETLLANSVTSGLLVTAIDHVVACNTNLRLSMHLPTYVRRWI